MLIEISTFRLASAAGDDEFLAADKAVQEEYFHQRPGFVRRTTARGDDGSWAVITMWGSAEYADASAAQAGEDPRWDRFQVLIDGGTLETRRYETLD